MFLPEHDSRGPLAMGESLSTWTPSCNGAVRVELSGQRTTSDSGALLLREALDNSGVIEALEDTLVDPRNPLRIHHLLAAQLNTDSAVARGRPGG